ncbi:MAG: sulfotransferase domain-containing protein [Gammaproteobacteria bacterium]
MNESTNNISLPRKTRELQNFLTDSTRWNNFQFRDDDIVITAWSKSGTTWVQQIVSQLIFNGDDKVFGQAVSPWIDFQLMPNAIDFAQSQTHRRFLKTHLPLDALVFSPRSKYLYIGRDARDVVWSLHHFMMSFTPFARNQFEELAKITGTTMPSVCPDISEFYRNWLEYDMHSENSFWQNVKGWWEARHLPNVLFVHYANLKADLPSEFRRIAKFLDITIDEAKFSQMLNHCSLEHMKDRASEQEFLEVMFQGGGRTFVNKGVNGRWRDVLTSDEIAKCDDVAANNLPKDCASWLKTGVMA